MMGKVIEFQEEPAARVEELGSVHEVLSGLISELHAAIEQRRGGQAVQEVLRKLTEYGQVHFAVEESLMRVLGYPGYEQHKAEHEELVEQIWNLRQKLYAGKHSITFELMHFLRSWLANHILVSDKDCRSFFAGRGVQPRAVKRFGRGSVRSADS
jgi:hemerythrin